MVINMFFFADQVQEVFVMPEPKVVVDLIPTASKVEILDPAVAAARAFNAAKVAAAASAIVEEVIPAGAKEGSVNSASSSGVSSAQTVAPVVPVVPVVGGKRTIMDMFAAQKKVVKTEDVSELVKID